MDFSLANCDQAGVFQSLARPHLNSLKKKKMHKGIFIGETPFKFFEEKKNAQRNLCHIRKERGLTCVLSKKKKTDRQTERIITQHPLSVSQSSKS